MAHIPTKAKCYCKMKLVKNMVKQLTWKTHPKLKKKTERNPFRLVGSPTVIV